MKNKKILARLIEENNLQKLAEETAGAVDPAAADKMAEDIFNQLFDQTMDEIGLNKLLG